MCDSLPWPCPRTVESGRGRFSAGADALRRKSNRNWSWFISLTSFTKPWTNQHRRSTATGSIVHGPRCAASQREHLRHRPYVFKDTKNQPLGTGSLYNGGGGSGQILCYKLISYVISTLAPQAKILEQRSFTAMISKGKQ